MDIVFRYCNGNIVIDKICNNQCNRLMTPPPNIPQYVTWDDTMSPSGYINSLNYIDE